MVTAVKIHLLSTTTTSSVTSRSQLPQKHKLVIAGNHDGLLDSKLCARPTDPQTLLTNATYLQDESVTIYGIKIYGSPWIPEHTSLHSAFSLPRGKALREHWRAIPTDIDVLVTHGPPWGHCDLTCKGYNVGCKDLLEEVKDRVKPKFHIFGHLHEGYGKTKSDGTVFMNVSTCDTCYEPINPPIVFDLSLPSGYSKTPR
ncbi:hypothetical protein Pmani_024452 [Petrolisthes manimaculis]|uniref:Calcineurin-like phosphoesterase domain-containing protein n=1 Tax=Petrolisthes manimaculis TaxID=1843537 RepID=A0AAE1PA43_9EUCA|nr:hypothetical protein Pmani_024452 [Petrolisthes manimaculis]